MDSGTLLIAIGALSAVAGCSFMIRIVMYLKSRGERVSFFLFRLKWHQYMRRYSELTVKDSGETGPWLRWYRISMLTALILVIAGALVLNR